MKQPRGRIFERWLHVGSVEPKTLRERLREALRVIDRCPMRGGFRCSHFSVIPNRLAVAPPIKAESPARQLLAGIPFTLAVMEETAWRDATPQTADQLIGAAALRGTYRIGVPFRRLIVVRRHEGRLAAHGLPHVALWEIAVDLFPECVERAPCRLRERVGDARRFGHSRDAHVEGEGHFRGLDRAADGGRGAKMRRGGERQMTFG